MIHECLAEETPSTWMRVVLDLAGFAYELMDPSTDISGERVGLKLMDSVRDVPRSIVFPRLN